jgi:hypothetical protein
VVLSLGSEIAEAVVCPGFFEFIPKKAISTIDSQFIEHLRLYYLGLKQVFNYSNWRIIYALCITTDRNTDQRRPASG